jgi:hypothetical protein
LSTKRFSSLGHLKTGREDFQKKGPHKAMVLIEDSHLSVETLLDQHERGLVEIVGGCDELGKRLEMTKNMDFHRKFMQSLTSKFI